MTFEESTAEVRAGLATNTAYSIAVRHQALYGHQAHLLMQAAVKAPTTQVRLAKDMPAPDELLDYGNGLLEAAMFHYAGEGARYDVIAVQNGFAVSHLALEDDSSSHALQAQYEADGDGMRIAAQWDPVPPTGWTLAAKYDTEDGLYAMFITRAGK